MMAPGALSSAKTGPGGLETAQQAEVRAARLPRILRILFANLPRIAIE
jgi:hypothetical protein